MILVQEIKFKNDYNGNGRSIVQVYYDDGNSHYLSIYESFNGNNIPVKQLMTEQGYFNNSYKVLPSIYSYDSYTSYTKLKHFRSRGV